MSKGEAKKKGIHLLSRYDHYVPGPVDLIIFILMFVIGVGLASAFSLLVSKIISGPSALELEMLISYPVMFLPAMLYAVVKSGKAASGRGVRLDSNNYTPSRGPILALLSAALVVMIGFMSDAITNLLPPMPELLKQTLESMTSGNVVVNLVSVSLFAPFFEEWLCRGIVMRGLLSNGVKPFWGIVLSALFFALIHANPWQAVPAFIIGCLFGYIYYRTGSLKLTMLMHCVNNTLSVVLSHISAFDDMDTWLDVMPMQMYYALFIVFAVLSFLALRKFRRVELKDMSGNFDRIVVEE